MYGPFFSLWGSTRGLCGMSYCISLLQVNSLAKIKQFNKIFAIGDGCNAKIAPNLRGLHEKNCHAQKASG
jgi:hypothetical protein